MLMTLYASSSVILCTRLKVRLLPHAYSLTRMIKRLIDDNKICTRQVPFKMDAGDQALSSSSLKALSQLTTLYYIPSATEEEITAVQKAAYRAFVSTSQRKALRSKVDVVVLTQPIVSGLACSECNIISVCLFRNPRNRKLRVRVKKSCLIFLIIPIIHDKAHPGFRSVVLSVSVQYSDHSSTGHN